MLRFQAGDRLSGALGLSQDGTRSSDASPLRYLAGLGTDATRGAALADARRRLEAPERSSQYPGFSPKPTRYPLPDAEQIVEHLRGKEPEAVKSISKLPLPRFLVFVMPASERGSTRWRLRPKVPEQVNGGCPGLVAGATAREVDPGFFVISIVSAGQG